MNVLSLDIGSIRVGVAWGSTETKLAFPLSILDLGDFLNNSKKVKGIIEEFNPGLLVIGNPVSLNGEENSQSLKVKDLGSKIAKVLSLPVEFVDERLTSKQAKKILKNKGLNQKQMRGKLDDIAASLILQTWFDAKT